MLILQGSEMLKLIWVYDNKSNFVDNPVWVAKH